MKKYLLTVAVFSLVLYYGNSWKESKHRKKMLGMARYSYFMGCSNNATPYCSGAMNENKCKDAFLKACFSNSSTFKEWVDKKLNQETEGEK